MNLLLAALLAVTMPRNMARARDQSNKRVRAERQWQTAAPRLPRVRPGAAAPVAVPVTGTYTDASGRKITVSFIVNLLIEDVTPPPPPPPPVGITFAGVQDVFGAPVTAASAGKLLFLKGAGFPTTPLPGPTSSLRLALAGQAVSVEAWTATSIQWHLDNSFTNQLTAPVIGEFQVWSQENGSWKLLGHGGTFTVLPG